MATPCKPVEPKVMPSDGPSTTVTTATGSSLRRGHVAWRRPQV